MPPDGAAFAGRIRRALPALALFIVLAGASLLPSGGTALRLASPDRSHVDQLRAAIGQLQANDLVLVACDADLGTYPEIRAATRAALDDLVSHRVQLAFVSFTPDGRAIAAGEIERLRSNGGEAPVDLGFIAGSEAGLVRAVSSIVPEGAGPAPAAIRERGGGIGAFDLVLIISGGDFSARSWIEQVSPRLPKLPMIAIAPTFLDPELEPYLRTGQLAGLLATLREGIAYAEAVGGGSVASPASIIRPLPMLIGMLIALGALGDGLIRQVTRRGGRRS